MPRKIRFLLALALMAVSARADTLIGAGSGGGFLNTSQFIRQTYASEQMVYCRVASSDTFVIAGITNANMACQGMISNTIVQFPGGQTGTVAPGNNAAFSSASMAPQVGGAGNWASLNGNGAVTQFGNNVTFAQQFALTGTANVRVWAAITASTATQATFPGVLVGTANGTRFVGLNYDSAVRATWACCAGNGANYNCYDTGIAPDTNWHTASIYYPTSSTSTPGGLATSLTCALDGVSTVVPASTGFTPAQGPYAVGVTTAGLALSITALDVAAHTLNYSWLWYVTF